MNNTPPFNLTEEMLNLVAGISEMLGSIKNIADLNKLPRLRKIGRIHSIQSSLAIENNSLSFEQVSDIINGKRVFGPQNEIEEVKNAFATYQELENVDPYDINDMLKIHGIMTSGLIDESGKFRTVNEGIYDSNGKAVHIAPPPNMVQKLMDDLFSWLRNSKVHPLIRSSVFHYEFEFIHPFRDGNGRIGRLWQTAILMNWKPVFAWIPVESVIRERQQEYYDSISISTAAGNSDAFVIFMLNAISESVRQITEDARSHLDHINTRVRELMAVMEFYPLSSMELMERLGLTSRDAFRNNYMRPAIEAGLVSLTEPDRPTSKNQMYFKK